MPYATTYTLSDLIAETGLILSDTGNVYWTQQEITYAIYEALREWSADTSYWRDRGLFNISPTLFGNPWYELDVYLPTLRPRTVTVDQIVREIQLHLSEPGSGISGAGMTSQFSINTILQSVVRARNRFVQDAMLPYSVRLGVDINPPPIGRLYLDQSIVYLHRATWIDSNGVYYTLDRSDEWAFTGFLPNWPTNPATPACYSQVDSRPLEIQLFPIPLASGKLELVSVDSIQLDTTDPATTLAVPDDFAHAIKYSAMADLLTVDAETANPFIAQYCQKRYESIVAAARQQRTVLQVLVNSSPTAIVPLTSLDRGMTYWRNISGTPSLCGTLYDILVFAPVPSTNFGVTVDLVRSAVIPQSPTDVIQLGREEIETVIKYVQHYLSLKLGGDEFQQTFPLYDDFQSSAGQFNGTLNVQARYLGPIFNQPAIEQSLKPDSSPVGVS